MIINFTNYSPTNSSSCAICQDSQTSPEWMSHDLPLNEKVKHVFHTACLVESLKKTPSCPLCRVKVNVQKILPKEELEKN